MWKPGPKAAKTDAKVYAALRDLAEKGQRIPKLAVLAADIGMDPGTLRIAMSRLAYDGQITLRRVYRGFVVRFPDGRETATP